MPSSDHPLFKHYPLTGTASISIGEVPLPYQIYNGYGLFIGGVGELEVAQCLLRNEALTPVQTADGKAIVGLWICNFTDASLGPHHELQISFFVSRRPLAPLPNHPLNTLALLLTRRNIHMLCYGLWNNTQQVVAYNRELLSLNAQLTSSAITRSRQHISFSFAAADTQQPILTGTIARPQRSSVVAGLALLRSIGFRRSMALTRQPWVSMPVLNPVGVVLNRNAAAETFTHNDVNAVRYYDQRLDRLDFGATPYQALQFMPQCVQYMDGFKFVYLQPT